MMGLGKARLFSSTVAIVAVLAWFTGTNHCLLGLVKQPGGPAVSLSQCPGHCQKTGAAPSAMLACCQGLLSPDIKVAKARVTFIPVLVATQPFAIDRLILPEAPKSILPKAEYDIGPPSVSSFAGTVLGRSLRENAPPRLY